MSTRVVVGIDGSPASIDALRTGRRIADALTVDLAAVAVWDHEAPFLDYVVIDRDEESEADQLLEAAGNLVFGLEWPAWFTTKARSGSPSRVLVDESSDAALLILGGTERGLLARILHGSVSGTCVEHAHCPVLVMHTHPMTAISTLPNIES